MRLKPVVPLVLGGLSLCAVPAYAGSPKQAIDVRAAKPFSPDAQTVYAEAAKLGVRPDFGARTHHQVTVPAGIEHSALYGVAGNGPWASLAATRGVLRGKPYLAVSSRVVGENGQLTDQSKRATIHGNHFTSVERIATGPDHWRVTAATVRSERYALGGWLALRSVGAGLLIGDEVDALLVNQRTLHLGRHTLSLGPAISKKRMAALVAQ